MKMIRVKLDNSFQADVLSEMLTEEGILHHVVSNRSEAYNGLFQLSLGWGYIEIPEEFKQRTADVMERYSAFIDGQSKSDSNSDSNE